MKKIMLLLVLAVGCFLNSTAQDEFIIVKHLSHYRPDGFQLSIWGSDITIHWEEVGFPQNKGIVTNINSPNGYYSFNIDKPISTTDGFPKYILKISGGLTRYAGGALEIKQWGNIAWSTMASAFTHSAKLQITATDVPDLSRVTDMSSMFANCTELIGHPSMNNWNTATVTNMREVFSYCRAFNTDIGSWNTVNVTNMHGMFSNADAFNQPIGSWNTGKVTDMGLMFYLVDAFDQDIGNWNTSKVTNFGGMLDGASTFNQSLANWDISSMIYGGAIIRGTAVDCGNYDRTIAGWLKTAPKRSMNMQVSGLKYSSPCGVYAREILSKPIAHGGEYGWSFAGDTYDPSCAAENTFCASMPEALVEQWGGNPVSGNISKKVWISAVQPAAYVGRHYEITPVNNPQAATGRVTLFFTNQEFKDFNAQTPAPAALLPDANDPATTEARKANLLVEKRSGTSSDGSGLPETYTGTVQNINPEDANIVWNTDANRWEVTFAVTGFSGFFVKTQATALPVNFGPVEAFFRNGQLFVNWSTLTETNNHHFDIEISADGKTFKKTGSLLSKATGGNASTPLNYSFSLSQPEAIALAGLSLLLLAGSLLYGLNKKWRCIPVAAIMALTALIACSKNEAPVGNQAAKAFIRISQVDIDGKKSYSKTVQVEQR
ncbi:MAG TPA: BspA family leucine-rich repeat surface protein [Niabella sp.]|nr:BspA family leucine-rich repeat surface protein [Niabella sp.]